MTNLIEASIKGSSKAAIAQRVLLRIPPLSELGTPLQLVKAFGDKAAFERAVEELQSALYEGVA